MLIAAAKPDLAVMPCRQKILVAHAAEAVVVVLAWKHTATGLIA
jgi:hypothetical protein